MEVDENLKRSELNSIEIAEHMVRREELLEQLGVRMKRGANQYSEGLISTTELAKEVGMTNRMYRLRRQPAQILEECRDLLRDSDFAENLTNMVKLSQLEPEQQRRGTEKLITGEASTFKKAVMVGCVEVYNQTREFKIDFDLKGRWGIPTSIMRFKKESVELQQLCNLISKDEDLELTKRKDLHFGESRIPLYGMMADLAEFLVCYYTPEGGLVLDNFMGRGTIGLASLWSNRKFIGYDVVQGNVAKFEEVVQKHLPYAKDNYQVYKSDGCELEELADKENYLDAVVTDPPYCMKAERYSEEEMDISHLSHDDYMAKIKINFQQLYRLIKKSNFEEKIFHPVIFKVGAGRDGRKGIVDMDSEFQAAAKECGFVLWDKLYNQLCSPWVAVNWERNYVNRYVQKSHEVSLVFVKF